MAKDNACDRGWIRHCGQDRRPLLPIQASFANAAQFFNSLLARVSASICREDEAIFTVHAQASAAGADIHPRSNAASCSISFWISFNEL